MPPCYPTVWSFLSVRVIVVSLQSIPKGRGCFECFFLKIILFGTSEDGARSPFFTFDGNAAEGFVSGYRRLSVFQDALREYQSSAQVFTFVWKFGGLSFGFEVVAENEKKKTRLGTSVAKKMIRHVSHTIHVLGIYSTFG